MRKALVILGLVAATLLTAAGDSFAQRRGGFGRGLGGFGGGYGNGWGGSSFYGGRGYYGNYFGSPFYGSGYGSGYYGYSPYYYGRGYYGPQSYGSYYQPYYGGNYYGNYSNGYAPGYYSDSSTYAPSMNYRDSSYVDPNAAAITVLVPDANAQVWFDDAPTTQRGTERIFHTPALQQAGTYTIKARWNENGRAIDQTRTVQVQPGQPVTVDFRASSAQPAQTR